MTGTMTCVEVSKSVIGEDEEQLNVTFENNNLTSKMRHVFVSCPKNDAVSFEVGTAYTVTIEDAE